MMGTNWYRKAAKSSRIKGNQIVLTGTLQYPFWGVRVTPSRREAAYGPRGPPQTIGEETGPYSGHQGAGNVWRGWNDQQVAIFGQDLKIFFIWPCLCVNHTMVKVTSEPCSLAFVNNSKE